MQSEYQLPALKKISQDELIFSNSLGKILGLGITYRSYFINNWIFWGGEFYPYFQIRLDKLTNSPDKNRMGTYHLDLGLQLGSYLFFSEDCFFRMGVLSTFQYHFSMLSKQVDSNVFHDFTIAPFSVFFEWNIVGIILQNEIRFPYSLGITNGLLAQKWLFISNGYLCISIGLVIRW